MDSRAFDSRRIAEGYSKRPFLHKQVMEWFQEDVSREIFREGLDVGCGAGLSMKALKMICEHVTGADISENMVDVAREVCGVSGDYSGYSYLVCKAEEIPMNIPKVDIVTAAGVIQWVEQDRFLDRMNLVMKDKGYLLIYDFSISDTMVGNSDYTRWWYDSYLEKFPKPYRNEEIWTEDEVNKHHFHIIKQCNYEMEYEFTLDSFIEFMMIQSNVNMAIDEKRYSVDEVRNWFNETLKQIFIHQEEKVIFKGYRWYLQK